MLNTLKRKSGYAWALAVVATLLVGVGVALAIPPTNDDAYVSHLGMKIDAQTHTQVINDGGDSTDDDTKPGQDASNSNRKVRTFDGITYTINYSTTCADTAKTYDEAYLCVETTLNATSDEAVFNTSSMGWIVQNDSDHPWAIVANDDGTQTLTAWRHIVPESTAHAIPNDADLNVDVAVRGAQNGKVLKPEFRAWLEGNSDARKQSFTDTEAVTVTATPSYNVKIQPTQRGITQGVGTFDFTTGNDLALNKNAGSVDGAIWAYGITLELYAVKPGNGLKGIELPNTTQPITFDVELGPAQYVAGSQTIDLDANGYIPLVWSYGPNMKGDQIDGRDVTTYGEPYAKFAAPFNSYDKNNPDWESFGGISACSNGGAWAASQTGSTVHFTVSDYVIDTSHFPTGNGGTENTGDYPADTVGAFSAGELYVVVPTNYTDPNTNQPFDLTERYGGGKVALTVTDHNLSMTSVSQKTMAQVLGEGREQAIDPVLDANEDYADDTKVVSIDLLPPGEGGPMIMYGAYKEPGSDSKIGCNTSDVNNKGDYASNSEDAAALGATVGLQWGCTISSGGNARNAGTDVDALLKFDPTGVRLREDIEFAHTAGIAEAMSHPTATVTTLYAGKDGGWASDEEQAQARIEDLVYYDSLEKLEASGKTFVGILVQVRGYTHQTFVSDIFWTKAYFDVINDAANVGKVFQITSDSNAWTGGRDIPSLLDIQNDPEAMAAYDQSVTYHIQNNTYKKQVYAADGNPDPNTGDTGNKTIGDSLLVVGYQSQLSVKVDQKDESGKEKANYDLDVGQYVVDLEIDPSMLLEKDISWPNPTTMTIVATLPANASGHALSYIAGSSAFGGTYAEKSTGDMSGAVSGGDGIEPSVTTNADGSQTLVWTIPGVNVNEDVPHLHFKALIPPQTQNAEGFTVDTAISTTEDKRDQSFANLNRSTTSIQTTKNSSITPSDTVRTPVRDVNDTIVYDIGWYNNSASSATDRVLLDIIPHSDDAVGSSYSGGYDQNGIGLALDDFDGLDPHLYSVYYTTDEAAAGTLSSAYSLADFTGGNPTVGGVAWERADATATNTTLEATLPADARAFVVVRNDGVTLPASKSIRGALSLRTGGNKPGDTYVNTTSIGGAMVTAKATIVNRALEGVVWVDANRDGKRQSTEELVGGVAVKLVYVQDGDGHTAGDTVQNLLGEECVVQTDDATGAYRISNLPAGAFDVVFADGDTSILYYRATTQNVGDGSFEAVDSDAEPTYDEYFGDYLMSAKIASINMPFVEEEVDGVVVQRITNSSYVHSHEDLGLFEWGAITLRKVVAGSAATSEDRNKEFWFTLVVQDEDGNVVQGEFDLFHPSDPTTSLKVKSGDRLSLKHGEEAYITHVPEGSFIISEDATDGYGTSHVVGLDAQPTIGLEAQGTVEPGVARSVTFTNTRDVTSLTVTKVWNDKNNSELTRPTEQAFAQKWHLHANGVVVADADPVVDAPTAGNWTITWNNLPALDSTGNAIAYSATEDVIPGYGSATYFNAGSTVTGAALDGATVTNSLSEEPTATARLTKSWVDYSNALGERPSDDDFLSSLHVYVAKADGTRGTEVTDAQKTLSKNNNTWIVTFQNLPKYQENSVVPNSFVFSEDAIDGYTTVIDGTSVTNMITTKPVKDATFTKYWNDQNGTAATRLDNIALTLYDDYGRKVNGVTQPTPVKSGSTWTYTYTNLPKYHEDGSEIIYYVTEGGVDLNNLIDKGYVPSSTRVREGTTLTNTPSTQVTVTKRWLDGDYEHRPSAQSFASSLVLLANGGATTGYAPTVTDEGNGTYTATWQHVPALDGGGRRIAYTVREKSLAGYATTYEGEGSSVATGQTITNTLLTDVQITKEWNDGNDAAGIRPNTAAYAEKVALLANGTVVDATPTVSASGNTYVVRFTNVPKYAADGSAITYTVRESAVEGYDASPATGVVVAGGTLTNTPSKTSAVFVKQWADGDYYAASARPESLDLRLWQRVENGSWVEATVPAGQPTVQKGGSTWIVTYAELERYDQGGNAYEYSVTENAPATYEATYSDGGRALAGGTISNSPATTSIQVSKVWHDDGTANRPSAAELAASLSLWAQVEDGEAYEVGDAEASVTAEGDTYAIGYSGLKKCDANGKPITYSVRETVPGGYEATYSGGGNGALDGGAITNTQLTSVEVTKVWKDGNNRDNLRPAHVTVRLWNGTQEVTSASIEGTGNTWTHTFTNLPKYDEAGRPVAYAVTEDTLPQDLGYTAEVSGTTITNTHTPETTELTITKTWDDNGATGVSRPSVQDYQQKLHLMNDSVEVEVDGTVVTCTGSQNGNTYTYTFRGMPKNQNGQPIAYTVKEDAVPGYTANPASGVFQDGRLTNKHEPDVVQISATKVWNDDNNRDDLRKDVTLRLMKKEGDGEPVSAGVENKTIPRDATGAALTVTWFGLQKYVSGTSGSEIQYSVVEADVPEGYTSAVTGSAEAGFTITNTHTSATTSVSITKRWFDDGTSRPNDEAFKAKLHLLANGVEVEGVLPNVAHNSDGTYTITYDGLLKREAGKDIAYVVEEDSLEGYATEGSPAQNGETITNTQLASVVARKEWDDEANRDGLRKDVTFTLMRQVEGGAPEDAGVTSQTIAAAASGDAERTVTWSDLPAYDDEGKRYTYSVREGALRGYRAPSMGTDASGTIVVTNTHVPETTSITVTKAWDDDANRDGVRPPASDFGDMVALYADDVQAKDASNNPYVPIVRDNGNNTYAIVYAGLPRYRDGGQEIAYSVHETSQPNDYALAAGDDGMARNGEGITNVHTPATTQVDVTKIWDDENNADGVRPQNVTIRLRKTVNGVTTTAQEVVLSAEDATADANTWRRTITGLPKYERGALVTYTVDEAQVNGYAVPSISGTTVTNAHEAEHRTVTVYKRWDDDGDRDGVRPSADDFKSMVTLLKDGDATDIQPEVRDNGAGVYVLTYSDLPTYSNGRRVVYTVQENTEATGLKDVYVTSDDSALSGGIIVNEHDPQTLHLTYTKRWADRNNSDGIRPDEVTLELWKTVGNDAATKVKDIVLSASDAVEGNANTWQLAEDLPAREDHGKQVAYELREPSVPEGYEVSSVTDNGSAINALVNTHTPKTSLTVTKTWIGEVAGDVQVQLTANGDPVNGKVLTIQGSDSVTFEELNKYDQNDQPISYSAIELTSFDHVSSTVRKVSDTVVSITNTNDQTTVVRGAKRWEGDGTQESVFAGQEPATEAEESAEAEVQAQQDEDPGEEPEAEAEDAEAQAADAQGQDQTTETQPEPKTQPEPEARPEGVQVPETEPTQSSARPSSIQVDLLADGVVVQTKEVTGEGDSWPFQFDDLRVFDATDGHRITYTVNEHAVENYSLRAAGTSGNGYELVNDYAPGLTSVTVTKAWDDASNQDGLRPATVSVQLLANGAVVGEPVELAEEEAWTHTWSNLKRSIAGADVTYTVEEASVPQGYEASVAGNAGDGFTITNTHTPGTTTVAGKKVWDDSNNTLGKRPKHISVNLLANGKVVGTQEVSGEGNEWSFSFPNVPAYASGQAISYTVTEDAVEGYATSIEGTTITNTLESDDQQDPVPSPAATPSLLVSAAGKSTTTAKTTPSSLPNTGDAALAGMAPAACAAAALLVLSRIRSRKARGQ